MKASFGVPTASAKMRAFHTACPCLDYPQFKVDLPIKLGGTQMGEITLGMHLFEFDLGLNRQRRLKTLFGGIAALFG